jgi:ferritin-like metal-binding protein YciE
MGDQVEEILNKVNVLSDRVARIETHLEYQKEHQERVEKVLQSLEETKTTVHRHDLVIKSSGWFMGLIISFFTAKFFGKF